MAFAIKFGFKTNTDKATEKRMSKTQMNIFSTCIFMVAAFLVSWSYYMGAIANSITQNGSMGSLLSDVFFMSEVVLEINSCINPLIYAVRLVVNEKQ